MTYLEKHLWHYAVNAVIFIGGLALIVLNDSDQNLQTAFIIFTAILYFTWSLVHHHIHHQLHPRVVYEYALITTLGAVLAFFLVNL